MALLREAESSSPGGALSTVLNNPAQRELTRIQARESAKTKYAEMVRNLKLSPEAADKLFDLVADQETKKEGLFSELLSGEKDVAAALEDRTRSKKEMNDRIRALLGDANYEQYEHVNRDADAEETVNLLNRDLGTNAISGEPREKLKGLLAALPEIPMDGIDLFRSKESLAALFQQFEDLGNGILQQASAFLTPEQLSAAYAVRSNHINMYRSQITLGQQLVGKLREAQQ